MSEWKEYKLNELADVIMGQSPPSTSYNEENRGLPFLQGCSEFGERIPVVKYYCSEPKKIAPKDSILISVRAPVGVTNFADKEFVIGRGLASIVPTNSDLLFLFYSINQNVSKLEAVSQGSTFSAINTDELNKLKIHAPLIHEQQKIASILSTCDTVIEKTQAAIAKYKAIKQGMLHDLFTRGIDIKTGKLRPKYKDAPELYKESKLGWVPKEWEVDVLDNICDVTSSKRIYMNEYIEFGIPFYRSLEIILKSKNQEIGTTLYISKEKYETIEKQFGVPKYGDILITSVGTLGISYRVSINDLFYFKDGNLIWFRDFKNEEYSRFLLHSLNDLIRLQFDKITIGTSQKAFTIDKLKKLNIYVPKENETKLICTRIEMVNNKLQTEEKYLHKLQQIKAGLMGDLLSGKKKVKV